MGFFEHYFDIDNSNEEMAVCCPFPHTTAQGAEYRESNPSASVNIKKRLFHCAACGASHNELSFIQKVYECTFGNAARIVKVFNNAEDLEQWEQYMHTDAATQAAAKAQALSLGISEQVFNELRIASSVAGILMFPVFINKKLVDIRTYEPGATPKVKSRQGAISG